MDDVKDCEYFEREIRKNGFIESYSCSVTYDLNIEQQRSTFSYSPKVLFAELSDAKIEPASLFRAECDKTITQRITSVYVKEIDLK